MAKEQKIENKKVEVKESVQKLIDLDQFLSSFNLSEDEVGFNLLAECDEDTKTFQVSLKDMLKIVKVSRYEGVQRVFRVLKLKGYKVDMILQHLKMSIEDLKK